MLTTHARLLLLSSPPGAVLLLLSPHHSVPAMKRYLVQTRPPGTASDDDLATPAPAAAKKPKPAGGGGSGAAAGAAAQQTQQLPTSLVRGGWTQLGQGARVGFWPRRFAAQEQQLLRALLADIAWQQRSVQVRGRAGLQRRSSSCCRFAAQHACAWCGWLALCTHATQ